MSILNLKHWLTDRRPDLTFPAEKNCTTSISRNKARVLFMKI